MLIVLISIAYFPYFLKCAIVNTCRTFFHTFRLHKHTIISKFLSCFVCLFVCLFICVSLCLSDSLSCLFVDDFFVCYVPMDVRCMRVCGKGVSIASLRILDSVLSNIVFLLPCQLLLKLEILTLSIIRAIDNDEQYTYYWQTNERTYRQTYIYQATFNNSLVLHVIVWAVIFSSIILTPKQQAVVENGVVQCASRWGR